MAINAQHEVLKYMLLKAQFWLFDPILTRYVISKLKFRHSPETSGHHLLFAALYAVSLRKFILKMSAGWGRSTSSEKVVDGEIPQQLKG